MVVAYVPHTVPIPGADLGGGCRGCAPAPPRDDLRFSNTAGILQKKKTVWFIGVEVEQEMSAPPPKKNPGSALVFVLIWLQFGYITITLVTKQGTSRTATLLDVT